MDKWKAVDIAQDIFKDYPHEARQYILDMDFWYSMTETELKIYLKENKDWIEVNQLPEY